MSMYATPYSGYSSGYDPDREMYQSIDRAMKEAQAREARPRITKAMTGNEWMKLGTIIGSQKQLCGPLWYEGELCVLFADTNIGKSLLAVQIADMIASGGYADKSLPELMPQTLAKKVLYADFELSTSQFARRYSSVYNNDEEEDLRIPYRFSNNFVRIELNYQDIDGDHPDLSGPSAKPLSEILLDDIEKHINEHLTDVLIIDNITFMAEGTEQAAEALPLMKKLLSLKRKHGLSILILAHTPKRNLTNPLTRNDLQGSKMIINFVDSAFAIGESVLSKDLRYIKQIKQRNTEVVYGPDNVLDCVIGRTTPEFVGFKSVGTGPEKRHLVERNDSASRRERAEQLSSQGYTRQEIAEKLGVSRAQVYRYLPSAVKPTQDTTPTDDPDTTPTDEADTIPFPDEAA